MPVDLQRGERSPLAVTQLSSSCLQKRKGPSLQRPQGLLEWTPGWPRNPPGGPDTDWAGRGKPSAQAPGFSCCPEWPWAGPLPLALNLERES